MQITLLCLTTLFFIGTSASFLPNKYINILKTKAKGIIAGSLTAYCLFPANLINYESKTNYNFLNSVLKVSAADDSLDIKVSGNTLQDQLKSIQQEKINSQKEMAEKQERDLLARQLQYPEGKLISRGTIVLNAGDSTSYPFGFLKATDLDPLYGSDTSTLFILGVGREGPPLAAKRFKLNELKFPFSFELTTSDLLFPYTEEAYKSSSNSKDSIATTAIISSSNSLAHPANNERYGFGLSNPATFAGVLTRSAAGISVTGKIDGTLYSQEETDLLDSVDKELDRIENIVVKK